MSDRPNPRPAIRLDTDGTVLLEDRDRVVFRDHRGREIPRRQVSSADVPPPGPASRRVDGSPG